ncbi:hypothetical protein CH304_16210 [Rhodococcus sp. 15-649-1-2]|nr:hypothetical protein CH304_16210 [Rhodococcus sp. 15-649-1-2]
MRDSLDEQSMVCSQFGVIGTMKLKKSLTIAEPGGWRVMKFPWIFAASIDDRTMCQRGLSDMRTNLPRSNDGM